MRDYAVECERRVAWIKDVLAQTGAKGIVFGNSGGKDSALVGILCRKATENVLGVIMPCGSRQNYGTDTDHAKALAEQFGISTAVVDLTPVRDTFLQGLHGVADVTQQAKNNINPRLRMTTVYTIGQSMGYLVAGTGNKSEAYMGYFTKWGDGAYDFNPIGDLYAHEIFEFLEFLQAPAAIIEKAPSAGLFDGQTDEGEMGVSYKAIDTYIATGQGDEGDKAKILAAHKATEHKRRMPLVYDQKL